MYSHASRTEAERAKLEPGLGATFKCLSSPPQWPTVSSGYHLLNIENAALQLVTKPLKHCLCWTFQTIAGGKWEGVGGDIYSRPGIRDLRTCQFFYTPRYRNAATYETENGIIHS